MRSIVDEIPSFLWSATSWFDLSSIFVGANHLFGHFHSFIPFFSTPSLLMIPPCFLLVCHMVRKLFRSSVATHFSEGIWIPLAQLTAASIHHWIVMIFFITLPPKPNARNHPQYQQKWVVSTVLNMYKLY